MTSFITSPVKFGQNCSIGPRWVCSSQPPPAGTSATGKNARRFAKWIAAEWGNRQQAMDNPPMWAHIHVAFRPLPWDLLDGYAFYTESAYDFDLSSPYKTSVVHIVNDGNGQLELASCKLQNADEYWMGAYEPSLLEGLQRDKLTKMADVCNTTFVWNENQRKYIGSSRPGKGCRIRRAGTDEDTYLESQIELTEESYSAWDIGRDFKTDKLIWGPPGGAFVFSPLQRFADLLPEEPMSKESSMVATTLNKDALTNEK